MSAVLRACPGFVTGEAPLPLSKAVAGSTGKTLKLYDGLYHVLPREPEKEEIFADVVAWVKEKL